MTDPILIPLQDHPSISQRFIGITPDIARQIVALARDGHDEAQFPFEARIDDCMANPEELRQVRAERDKALAEIARLKAEGQRLCCIYTKDMNDRAAERDKALADLASVTAQRDRLAGLLRLARGHDCDHLHHAKRDRHGLQDPCPVLCRIDAALAELEKMP